MKNKFVLLSAFILFFTFSNANDKPANTYFAPFQKGYNAYLHDSFEVAIKYMSDIIGNEKKSMCTACFMTRGGSNFALGNFKEALSDYSFAIKNKKNNEETNKGLLFRIAQCQYHLNNKEAAEKGFNNVIHSSQDTLDIARSYAYLNSKGNPVSLSMVNDKIKADENNVSALKADYISAAIICSTINQPATAVEYLERSLKLGYSRFRWLEITPDLKNVQSDPKFKELLTTYKMKN